MPGGTKDKQAAQPAPVSCLRPDTKPPGTASSRRRERISSRDEAAVNAMAALVHAGSKSFPRQRREPRPTRTTTEAGSISDLDNGLISTAPDRRREWLLTRTEAAAVFTSDPDDDLFSTAPSLRRERRSTHTSPPHTHPTPPPHTHPGTPPHLPVPHSLPTPLTLHPYHVAIPPVAGAVPQGFLATGFPPWGAPGAYIHATHALTSTLHTIHVPPTRPLHAPSPMTGSPQAETGTSVYWHRRRRRHRNRHDGTVAHPAQLPAATPRCRNLPDSSLAARVGREPSRCRRREGRGRSAGPGPFTLGLPIPPPPPPPSPSLPTLLPPTPPLHTHLRTHYTLDPHTHTPDTYTYPHAPAPLCAAQLCSIPDPLNI